MQPRTIAVLIVLLPWFAVNAAYLISASAGQVAWCIPYLEGCTSISRAARKSDAIFLFRGVMIAYAVLLIYYWRLAQLWLNKLDQRFTLTSLIIFLLGMTGALFLILYVDFLGTHGAMYRFMRRYGVLVYFSFTPLAHLIMLGHLYKLKKLKPGISVSTSVLRYQLGIIALIAILGLTNIVMGIAGIKTFESESIVEWNYSLLLTLLFAGSIAMWKNLRMPLEIN